MTTCARQPGRRTSWLRSAVVPRRSPTGFAIITITALLAAGLQRTAARIEQDDPGWAEFGTGVAAMPETIFVAASAVKDGKRGPGAVHVFEQRSAGWVRTEVLAVPDARIEDPFGVSLAADGDTLVVGAQFADAHGEDSGQAYVFERRNERWHPVAVLSATDATAGDQFGLTVSVSGETIAVGARLADGRATNAGAAYVFRRRDGSWQQVSKLMASDGAAGDIFGRVSVDKDEMLVTADLNDDRGTNAGKAYAFQSRGEAWVEAAQLTASDAAEGDEFGVSLAARDGTAVFGAVGSNARGDNAGAAYVFERRDVGWVQVARLTASDAAAGHGLGLSVATSGDIAVAGAPNHGGGGQRAGAAYVFERRGGAWTQTARLAPSDAASLTSFGSTVSISRNTIVVGMMLNAKGKHPGAAYVFERRAGAWSEVARLAPESRR